MEKIMINGKGMILGRLASYVAKEAMKGEEIAVVNCQDVIITGNKKNIQEKFLEKRTKVGSGQKGPKHSRLNERIVKRTIRGMVGNHRKGRGKETFSRIRCYDGIPKEFEKLKKVELKQKEKNKSIKVKEIYNIK
jgi:large subunit ribosomal protein L13|tara:strand:- start:30 stop:434 length:405 start_codon:yes stop_codon:yes gene_type:complete